jgi:putative hydrolase of the HAD superfamily
LSLRAVVFDFGMVLTGQPDTQAHDDMVRMTGLSAEDFEKHYWTDRHAYDEGKLTGIAFWQKLLSDAKLELGPHAVEELNRSDARMWTTQNPVMVAWQAALVEHGIKTAILSNMGDSVLESISREFAWLGRFDVLIWSYQHLMAKPDPAIYRLTLQRLGTRPEETLFLDDKRENIDAALALGFRALQFTTVDQLRKDLVAAGYDRELPMPA